MEKAAAAGKRVITTKPLAPKLLDAPEGRPVVSASRDGRVSIWPGEVLPETLHDRYREDLEQDRPLESTAQEARRDVEILHAALARPGHRVRPVQPVRNSGLGRWPR